MIQRARPHRAAIQMAGEVHIAASSTDIPEISREELRRRLHKPGLTILDVLPAQTYASGHIPGAINLPFETIADRAAEVLPGLDAEIAVYCAKFT